MAWARRSKLTPSESVTIVESTPERAGGRGAPRGRGGKPPPKHYHPNQDERFTVLEGELRFRVGAIDRELAAGEEIEVPAGVAHQVWNPHAEAGPGDLGDRARRAAPSSGFAPSTRPTARPGRARRRARSPSPRC